MNFQILSSIWSKQYFLIIWETAFYSIFVSQYSTEAIPPTAKWSLHNKRETEMWIFVQSRWHIHDTFMTHSWNIHDIFITFSWHINDTFMKYSWYIHDTFLTYSWHIHSARTYQWLWSFIYPLHFSISCLRKVKINQNIAEVLKLVDFQRVPKSSQEFPRVPKSS